MKNHALRVVSSVLSTLLILCLTGCSQGDFLKEQLKTVALKPEVLSPEPVDGVSGEGAVGTADTTETVTITAEVQDLLYRQGSCYAYKSLNVTEALWYDEMAACIGGMQQEIALDEWGLEQGLNEGDVDRIFQCVLMDHPELFYVEGYTYTKYNRGDKLVGIKFAPTYSLEQEQVKARKTQIEQEAAKLIQQAEGFTDEYDKVKYVYETIIRTTEYDLSAPDNQNIYSVFVNHVSVCQGYAKAMQYILERLGIACTLVQGSVDTGEGHAWNLVKVNGSYYYVDATWGDASYLPDENGQESEYVPPVSYDYLCVTTNQLLQTHILGSIVELPVCTDTRDNYYVRENALFTTYDREQMRALFEKMNTGVCKEVLVKCDGWECYREIRDAMIEEQEIFDYLAREDTSVHYIHNEKQLSMSFWVTNE